MRKIVFLCLTALFLGNLVFATPVEENIYYARCNLKIIKGAYITWVNWQGTYNHLPVDTKLKVISAGSKASIVDVETEAVYVLDMGAAGKKYLEKFVTKERVNIKRFSEDVQESIKDAVARIGMTKEEVYVAMGPPSWISSGKTFYKDHGEIMSTDLWVYKRKRFGKNIGVEFDSATGKVKRTEGIWR